MTTLRRTNIWLTSAQLTALKKISKARSGVRVAALVRQAIDAYLQRNTK